MSIHTLEQPTEHNLEQGSLEWHEYRRKHFSASDAPTVMDCNPFATKRDLYERMSGIGKPFTGNVATRYGNKMEPIALEKLQEVLGIKLRPGVFSRGEFSASLDAINVKESIKVEIKCPYQKEDSKLWKTVNSESPYERIPENYFWQMTHQNMVIPTQENYLFVYIDDDTWRLVPLITDSVDALRLRDAWRKFNISCKLNPPPPPFEPREDLEALAADWTQKKILLDEAKAAFDLLDDQLKDACENDTAVQVGNQELKVKVIDKKGSVDYSRISELKMVDVDKYRRPSTSYKKVTLK